jgi:phosphoesterase RecJ-like protein
VARIGPGGRLGAPIPEPRWDTAVGLLRGMAVTGGRVGLFAHVNPDADSLGSALALGLALRAAGTDVAVCFDADPFRVPDGLAFLPGLDLLVAPADVRVPLRIAITLDVGAPGRLGRAAALLADAGHVVVVDHHRSSTAFGGTRLVDPAAASTSVIVTELLDRLGLPLTPDVATALYAGLVTDTGSFRQVSTNPAAHLLAARLVAAGADPAAIGWSVWGNHRLDYVRLLATVLGRVAIEPSAAGGAGLVWTVVTRDDFDAHHLDIEHVEGLIDVLWGIREAEVAAVLKELPGGGYTVSLRSRGRVDVGVAATALGGGGHREKSGFITDDDVTSTIRRIGAALESAVALESAAPAAPIEAMPAAAPAVPAVTPVPTVPTVPAVPPVATGPAPGVAASG